MANNGHRPGASAGNTFRAVEVDALNELFRLLDRGGDPRRVMRSRAITNVRRKFLHMAASIAKAAKEHADG